MGIGVDGAAWLDLPADRVNKKRWTAAGAASGHVGNAAGLQPRANSRGRSGRPLGAGPALQPAGSCGAESSRWCAERFSVLGAVRPSH